MQGEMALQSKHKANIMNTQSMNIISPSSSGSGLH